MTQHLLELHIKNELEQPSNEPLYLRIRDSVLSAMGKGLLKPGSKLPAERVLSEGLNVSRVTLRKAVDMLVESGNLVRQQGAKTIVAARLEKSVSRLTSFSDEMRLRGREPGELWISKSISRPSPSEAMILGLSQGAMVVRLERVRLIDGEPIAIERAAVPQSVLPSFELVTSSLYSALEKVGARPVRGSQRLRAVAATAKEAQTLHCAIGAPLLCIERTCLSAGGQCVEFTETRYLGSAYDFLTDLAE